MPGSLNLSTMTAAVCLLVPLSAHAQAPSPGLPDGPGKQLVEGVCTGCHQTNMITQSSDAEIVRLPTVTSPSSR